MLGGMDEWRGRWTDEFQGIWKEGWMEGWIEGSLMTQSQGLSTLKQTLFTAPTSDGE